MYTNSVFAFGSNITHDLPNSDLAKIITPEYIQSLKEKTGVQFAFISGFEESDADSLIYIEELSIHGDSETCEATTVPLNKFLTKFKANKELYQKAIEVLKADLREIISSSPDIISSSLDLSDDEKGIEEIYDFEWTLFTYCYYR